ILPVKDNAKSRTAGIETVVAAHKIVVRLSPRGARSLADRATGAGRNVGTEINRRQPWIQVLRMEMHHGPLKQTVAAEAVFIEGHFNFPQAIVDAIKEPRSKTPRLYFAVGPLILVLSLVKVHAEVRFDRRTKTPRLVRRFDIQTIARSIAKSRQGFRC